MAQNKGLNDLLKWSIENSTAAAKGAKSTENDDSTTAEDGGQAAAPRNLDPELLSQLLGGPSDAELMQAAIAHAVSGDGEGDGEGGGLQGAGHRRA